MLPLSQSKNLCELSVADNKFCEQIEYVHTILYSERVRSCALLLLPYYVFAIRTRFASKVVKKLPSLKVLDGDVFCQQQPDTSKEDARPTSALRGSVTPRRRATKSPRPGTASRSRPTLKSAHGRRTGSQRSQLSLQ